MNKLLQTTLIATIMATSAFSSTQQDGGTISGAGYIDEEAVMEMEANIKATMDRNAVIHNYNIIQGPAADGITTETVVGDENKATITALDNAKKAVIEGPNSARIINYDHIMEEDTAFLGLIGFEVSNPTYFRPTGGGRIQGAVDTTNVTVTSEMADLGRAIDLHNTDTDVMLLTLDCQEEEKTMRLTNREEEMKTVQASIANEVATGGGSNSHSLVVRGAFRFEGDQSRFNQDETTLTFSNSHSEIATPKSLFMRPIEVLEKSELVIDAEGVEMPHNVTVVNSQFIVNENASFTIKSGAKLLFKRLDTGYPYENPEQMIWPDGSFANPLMERYYLNNGQDRIYCMFWKEGETWKTDSEYITVTESNGTLMFTDSHDASNPKTYSGVSVTDLSKTYTSENPKVYQEPTPEGMGMDDGIKLHFSYAADDVFSYDYDSANNSWVRRAQYMIFQPGSIDPASITEDNSTWRILDLGGSYHDNSGTVTHAVMKNDWVHFYNLDETNKIFNYQFTAWQLSRGVYFEGNKDQGLWLQNTAVRQDREYEVTFVEKAKTNQWLTLADYGADYSFSE